MTPGLIERLEAAGEGSRELDVAVARSLAWFVHNARRNGLWAVTSGRDYAELSEDDADDLIQLDEITTSLDAALALAERVLPGDPDFEPTGPSVGWKINLYRGMVPAPLGGWIASLRRHASDGVEGSSSSPALALCIAILKARATQEQG